ncbi:MAG TPA: 4-hydroxythreonine-4-phosphate dehydrogenase PdxA [Nitrospirales bacterium]|nr:4-hydroxythreonine-4-phosphate dehydrogenase PdxA [Nitrospirales bacterium]
MAERPLIGITMGDPAGIGPEVIVKALAGDNGKDVRSQARVVIIGSYPVMEHMSLTLQLPCSVQQLDHLGNHTTSENIIHVLDPLPAPLSAVVHGKASVANGLAQVTFVKEAVRHAMKGDLDAIVTAPITKAAMVMAGYDYPGHTELLAELTGVISSGRESGMMLIGGPLRIMFVTTHTALRNLPSLIQIPNVMKAIRLADLAGREMFGISHPRIGVAGLNPHAGEDGLFGMEEIQVITPAVEQSHTAGVDCSGPFPADTLFQRASKGEFDVVVAMYHDQGLIPLKLVSFGQAVNITVGLPILRSSVDHGTAYDIAGKGIANPGSLIQALHTASQILERRTSVKAGDTQ